MANETRNAVTGMVVWALREPNGRILEQGREEVTVAPYSSLWLEKKDFGDTSVTSSYASYAFIVNGETISEGTALFCAPKHFAFADPQLQVETDGEDVTVKAGAYARQVWLESNDPDLLLSDNCFDLNAGEKRVKILRGNTDGIKARSVWNLGH